MKFTNKLTINSDTVFVHKIFDVSFCKKTRDFFVYFVVVNFIDVAAVFKYRITTLY